MKMKKLLSVMLTVAMVASMTACGSQDRLPTTRQQLPQRARLLRQLRQKQKQKLFRLKSPPHLRDNW